MAQGIFENQDIQAPQGGASVPQAVAPANTTANTLSSIGQGVSNLFSGIGQTVQQGKKEAATKTQGDVLSQYARTITGLDAAVSQGSMKLADAKRRQRATYNQLVANYPQLTDDLTKFNSAISGSEGLGDTLAKGTTVDQQIQADTKSATAAGFIQPGMSPTEQESGLNKYRIQQQKLNEMDFYSKQLEIQNKQLSIVNTQESIANNRVQRANSAVDLQIKRNKLGVQTATADVANNYLQKTLGNMEQLRQDLASGKISQEQALQQTQQWRNSFSSITQQVRGVAGGNFVDSLASPMMNSLDAFDQELSGKITSEVAQNKLDHATTMAALPFMADPKAASIAAASKIFANVPPLIMANFGPEMIKILQRNGQPASTPHNVLSNDPEDMGATKQYTDTLKSTINRFTGKDPTVEDPRGLQNELQMNVNQVLKSVGTMGSSVDNPSQFNNVVDFFASPSFLDFQKHGGQIDQSNREGALNVVREQYMNQLVPAMQKEWEASKTTDGYPTQMKQVGFVDMSSPNTQKTEQVIDYRWTGQSIVFQPAKGMEINRGAVAKAKELNRKLAPLVQKMVMMEAHMEGNQDYTKYFKEQEGNIFGTPKEAVNGQ